ncbi:MAG: NUDIX domain-containing protein [Bacteriovoracaceae bacterium]|nr:NUDIX domain-containing protein [Bacteriovoracaceae bacterium]
MIKRKVQTILFFRNANKQITFLILRMNQRRKSLWQNVTGSVDEGESFDQAAIREAKEETGLVDSNILKLHKLESFFEFTDQWKKDVHEKCFALEVKEKFEVVLDPSEHDSFKWINQEDINIDSVHYETNWTAIEEVLKRL